MLHQRKSSRLTETWLWFGIGDRFPADNPRLKEKAQEELKRINAAYEVLKSHQFSYSANTKPPTAEAKTHQASPPNHKPSSSTDAKSYYEQGIEKAKRGKYKEAIEDFNYEIRMNPYYAQAYKYRGIAYSKLGEKQRAFYDFKQVTDIYLRQGNINDYYDVIKLIKKLQTSESFNRVKTNYRRLQELLSAGQWKEADQETFAVMLKVAGREKEGWLRVEDIKKIPCIHLHIIDQLWVVYSNGHFGFSVQKRIWQSLGSAEKSDNKTWCDFCDRVYWRVKYNGQLVKSWVPYNHLVFDLNTTMGHLPAALPGKQYSLGRFMLYFVFMLFADLILSYLNSQWSSFIPGSILSSIFVLQEMYNGNQRYTKDWWHNFFSRLHSCEL